MNAAALFVRERQRAQIVEREARTADNNPLRKLEQPFRVAPAAQVEKRIRADDAKNRIVFCKRSFERGQGIHGVIRLAIFPWSVQPGSFKRCIRLAQERDHGQTAFIISFGSGRLQRLAAHRGKQNAVKVKAFGSGERNGKMSGVRWVKGAAIERNSHEGPSWQRRER